jgi:hypothetical protein
MNAAPGDEPVHYAPAATDAVAVHPVVAADAAVGRIVARLGVEYVLRTVQLMSQEAGGDLTTSVVLYAALAGNVGHLDRNPATAGQFDSLQDLPPDELRRPISVLAVANSLGLPRETVRRHVSKLVKLGRLVRVKGGVVGPAITHQGADQEKAMLTNVANVRRFFRGLKRAGFDFD